MTTTTRTETDKAPQYDCTSRSCKRRLQSDLEGFQLLWIYVRLRLAMEDVRGGGLGENTADRDSNLLGGMGGAAPCDPAVVFNDTGSPWWSCKWEGPWRRWCLAWTCWTPICCCRCWSRWATRSGASSQCCILAKSSFSLARVLW